MKEGDTKINSIDQLKLELQIQTLFECTFFSLWFHNRPKGDNKIDLTNF